MKQYTLEELISEAESAANTCRNHPFWGDRVPIHEQTIAALRELKERRENDGKPWYKRIFL